MKKRLARILAVTLGAATLLTGCGGNSGQKTSAEIAGEILEILEKEGMIS